MSHNDKNASDISFCLFDWFPLTDPSNEIKGYMTEFHFQGLKLLQVSNIKGDKLIILKTILDDFAQYVDRIKFYCKSVILQTKNFTVYIWS